VAGIEQGWEARNFHRVRDKEFAPAFVLPPLLVSVSDGEVAGESFKEAFICSFELDGCDRSCLADRIG